MQSARSARNSKMEAFAEQTARTKKLYQLSKAERDFSRQQKMEELGSFDHHWLAKTKLFS